MTRTFDYADQRFYSSQFGRFMSADRFRQAAKANDSGSWNKYSYTRGDPVNRFDPHGTYDDLCSEDPNSCEPPCEYDPSQPECSGDPGGGYPDPGGGTTDEGGPGFTPCKDAGCLPEALAAALKDLAKTQCAGLFGTAQTRDGAFNPTAVIQQVYNLNGGTVNGSSVGVAFSIFPSLIGDAAITPLKTVIIGTGSWGAWNQSGAVGDVSTLAGILLHELGHIYDHLSGSGGSQITYDGGIGNDASQANQDKIVNNCLK